MIYLYFSKFCKNCKFCESLFLLLPVYCTRIILAYIQASTCSLLSVGLLLSLLLITILANFLTSLQMKNINELHPPSSGQFFFGGGGILIINLLLNPCYGVFRLKNMLRIFFGMISLILHVVKSCSLEVLTRCIHQI